jgi:Cu+-exporting ATPase
MVALGRAAQNGILIRGGDTLERLAAVKQVAFDKTGTLTDGHLEVTAFEVATSETQPTSPADTAELPSQDCISPQSILVALQRASSHPIARAITKHFSTTPAAPLVDIQEHRGIGVEGRDAQGNSYRCGGRVMAAQAGVATTADVALLKNNQLLATLRVRDHVRPEAARVVRDVTALGLGVSIISGDTARKCAEIAADIGISEVYSEQLPEQKLERLRTKQVDTAVAYIGDGINDAPTLAEAAVGISIGSASDVAVQSAQVILTGNTLTALPKSIRLARITVRTIKQNLAWAVLYNVFAIPLAALGYVPPLAAALLMTVSDVVIVGNSLRIKWQRLQ